LVPGCTLSVLLKAFISKKTEKLWNYTESKAAPAITEGTADKDKKAY